MILVQLKLTVECIGWLATTWSPPPLSTTSHYRAKLGQWKNSRNFLETFKKLSSTSPQVAATVALNSASEKKRNFQKKLSKKFAQPASKKGIIALNSANADIFVSETFHKVSSNFGRREDHIAFCFDHFHPDRHLTTKHLHKVAKNFLIKNWSLIFLGKLFPRLINYQSFCRYIQAEWW